MDLRPLVGILWFAKESPFLSLLVVTPILWKCFWVLFNHAKLLNMLVLLVSTMEVLFWNQSGISEDSLETTQCSGPRLGQAYISGVQLEINPIIY